MNPPEDTSGETGVAAGPIGSACPLTDPQIEWLIEEAERSAKIAKMDNRQLLWVAMNTRIWKRVPMGGAVGAIFTEIESRLYPEYDGDKVKFEDWGWSTPDGDIRYLPNTEREGTPGL